MAHAAATGPGIAWAGWTSTTPTRHRIGSKTFKVFFWAAWWTQAPNALPWRKPDATGYAATAEAASADAERAVRDHKGTGAFVRTMPATFAEAALNEERGRKPTFRAAKPSKQPPSKQPRTVDECREDLERRLAEARLIPKISEYWRARDISTMFGQPAPDFHDFGLEWEPERPMWLGPPPLTPEQRLAEIREQLRQERLAAETAERAAYGWPTETAEETVAREASTWSWATFTTRARSYWVAADACVQLSASPPSPSGYGFLREPPRPTDMGPKPTPKPKPHPYLTSAARDAFQVLGLEYPSDAKAVKKAYRERAFVAHPDRGGDAAAFIRIKSAHDEALRWVQP